MTGEYEELFWIEKSNMQPVPAVNHLEAAKV
jgi:hypothetical protein